MTDDLSSKIQDIVQEGIIADIETLFNAGGVRGAVILTFCGIDAMAHLYLPEGKVYAEKADFMDWCERYLLGSPPLAGNTPSAITAKEIYSARYGVVHAYSLLSKLSDSHKDVRAASYDMQPFLIYGQILGGGLAINPKHFFEAFKNAVEKF